MSKSLAKGALFNAEIIVLGEWRGRALEGNIESYHPWQLAGRMHARKALWP
jgi:hypothetical protein